MPDLFSNETPVEESVALLEKIAAGDAVELGSGGVDFVYKAIEAVLGDRKRLLGIANLARAVREAQKRYFKDRNNLYECKALESKLDGMLKE